MTLRLPGYKPLLESTSIGWLKGCGNYTYVHMVGRPQPLLISQTLKHFEEQLAEFLRVSKSSMVNPLYVDRVVRESAKEMNLVLRNGTSIPVARRRIPQTIALLDSIRKNRIVKHQNSSPIKENDTAKDDSPFGNI